MKQLLDMSYNPDAEQLRAFAELTKPSWEQLIIIGNGFDLQCGLSSRFADFMKARRPLLENLSYSYDSWKKLLDEESITAWDFILKDTAAATWCNIEAAIERWITDPYLMNRLMDDTKIISDEFYNPLHVVGLLNGRPIEERNDRVHRSMNIARTYLVRHSSESEPPSSHKAFAAFLLEELNRIERSFSEYLWQVLQNNPDYLEESDRLLTYLIEDGWPGSDYKDNIVSLLNFNYTDPFDDRFLGHDEWEKINIHGTLYDDDIIFGIDGKEHMNDSIALPFTKTYRVVSQGIQLDRPLVSPAGAASYDRGTAVIKFYGHSLGEADYSYFQSIFDAVDLYGGRTKLVFYCRPGTDADPVKRASMVKAVSRLLSTYGSTLDNEDHGKNLMHKLVLEGRLTIKEVSFDIEPAWEELLSGGK